MEINNQINTVSEQQYTSKYSGSAGEVDYTQLGARGQIIEGVITSVLDTISINFNGVEVAVPKSAVQDAKEGEIRSFEIKDVTKTSIVLKEMGKTSQSQPGVGVMQTKVEEDRNHFEQKLEQTNQEEEENNVEKLEEEIESISNRITEEDVNLMEEEGMSLEKYNMERLDRVLNRIKESKIFKRENIERIVEQQKTTKENIEKIVRKNQIDNLTAGGMEQKIAESLEAEGLPITKENIKKITDALEMTEIIPKLSDRAKGYLVEQQLEPTIENMYQAQYTSSNKYSDYKKGAIVSSYSSSYGEVGFEAVDYKISTYEATVSKENVYYEMQQPQEGSSEKIQDELWEQLKPQIEIILKEAGMEVSEETLENAKWLLQRNLPITPENIQNVEQIEQVKQEYSKETIINDMVKTYAMGKEPVETVAVSNVGYTRQSVEAFLSQVQQQMKELEPNVQETLSIDEITKYRQLEEIRLKMTVEAANRLSDKGIQLDTTKLSEIVEGLREIENQYYRNLLQEGNVIADDENINVLKETTEKVEQLKDAPNYVLGVTFKQREEIDVTQLHKEAVSMKQQLDKASETYEALMTEPRKDLGDSIKKAFRNIDDILEDLGLEQTQANERAVRILGYNRMDITKENIMHMKEYDAQVNQTVTKLHPAVTVELIRKGKKPLDMPIRELNQEIETIKEELGISEEEKYSRYLWKLEKNQEITEQERETFIGIYRLLNNVEKTDGAAVGHVLQAEQEVTLRNLFTAVKTIKRGSIDWSMEEDTGLSEITFSKEPLIQQLDQNFSEFSKNNGDKDNQAEKNYMQQVVKELYEEITPEKLQQVISEETEGISQLMNTGVEKLLEEVKGKKEQLEHPEKIKMEETEQTEYEVEFLKNLESVKENSKQAIEFLTAQQLPINLKNIVSAQELMSNGEMLRKWKDKIKELPEEQRIEAEKLIDSFSEGLIDEETMEEKYTLLKKSVSNILHQEYGKKDITAKELLSWKQFSNCMELVQSLSQKKSYEIPILAGEGITRLNVTLINQKEKDGKVEISINSEQLGKIQGTFFVKGQEVRGDILGNNPKGLEKIEEIEPEWRSQLENEAIYLKDICIQSKETQENGRNKIKSKKQEEDTDTKVLYKVAKTFVQQVKELERGIYYEN